MEKQKDYDAAIKNTKSQKGFGLDFLQKGKITNESHLKNNEHLVEKTERSDGITDSTSQDTKQTDVNIDNVMENKVNQITETSDEIESEMTSHVDDASPTCVCSPRCVSCKFFKQSLRPWVLGDDVVTSLWDVV